MLSVTSTNTIYLLILLYGVSKLVRSVYTRITRLGTLHGPPAPSFLYGHELQIRQSPTNKFYPPWMEEYGHAYKTRGVFYVRFYMTPVKMITPIFTQIETSPEHYRSKGSYPCPVEYFKLS